jgi:acyl-CoA synthetase (AMP-forming)/AMP-acid ligase II
VSPGRQATVDGFRRWGYTGDQLRTTAEAFADRLRDAGVHRGDRLVIWSENRLAGLERVLHHNAPVATPWQGPHRVRRPMVLEGNDYPAIAPRRAGSSRAAAAREALFNGRGGGEEFAACASESA